MALDFMPAQATSVPCEAIFSLAANTDTPRRACISDDMMESLQVLKYLIHRQRLSFTAHLQSMEKVQEQLIELALQAEKEEAQATSAAVDIEDEELIQMKGQIIERTQQVRSMPSICCAALTTDVTHTVAEIPLSISCDNNTPEGKPVGACLEIPKECCGPGPSTSQASRFPVLYGQVPEQGRCSIQ